jgi:hypothetical protein
MFDLQYSLKGERVLVYTKRDRRPGERGVWVEIGHEKEKNIRFFVEWNERNGLQVEKDDKGFYRALVLKD